MIFKCHGLSSALCSHHKIIVASHLSFCCPLQASVKPKCGRMVGFSSGGENPHGVKAVTSGQRCAVALWFTLNPLYRELVKRSFFVYICWWSV